MTQVRSRLSIPTLGRSVSGRKVSQLRGKHGPYQGQRCLQPCLSILSIIGRESGRGQNPREGRSGPELRGEIDLNPDPGIFRILPEDRVRPVGENEKKPRGGIDLNPNPKTFRILPEGMVRPVGENERKPPGERGQLPGEI